MLRGAEKKRGGDERGRIREKLLGGRIREEEEKEWSEKRSERKEKRGGWERR